jgi:hypothetical protein
VVTRPRGRACGPVDADAPPTASALPA